MEYNWDLNKLKHLKKEYQMIRLRTQDLTKEDKLYCCQKEEDLNDMIKNMTSNEEYIVKKLRIEILSKPHIKNNQIREYNAIPKFVRKMLFNSIKAIHDVREFASIPYSHISLSNQDLIDLAREFFRWIPNKNYYPFIDSYTNLRNHYLRFSPTSSLYYNGGTFFFDLDHSTPYFEVRRKQTLEDIFILNHELAHGIYGNLIRNFENSSYYYLAELEGLYFEYLTVPFLEEKKLITHEETQIFYLDQLDIFFNCLSTFYFHYLLIRFKKKRIPPMIENLEFFLDLDEIPFVIDEEMLREILKEKVQVDAKYAFSYLVSFYLQNLNDVEKSFSLFEKLKYNRTPELQDLFNKHNMNIHDFYYLKERTLSLTKK